MEIPGHLIRQMKKGKVVLFLGSGANYGSRLNNGNEPPLGDALKDILVDEFLEPEYKSESLQWVSELAIENTSLSEVQGFIADLLDGIVPAEYHKILTEFKWRGIATTNYDRLVETIYEKSKSPVQDLVVFRKNEDKIDEKINSSRGLALLKLHGCITISREPRLPLILTVEQYERHKHGRNRLFSTLEEWGHENTIVFVGYSGKDQNIRSVLLKLAEYSDIRPKYYLVDPNARKYEVNMWAKKNIVVLKGTFGELLSSLSKSISRDTQNLIRVVESNHPISRKVAGKFEFTNGLSELLQGTLDYVHDNIPYKVDKSEKFYSGFDLGWYPIISNLDLKRKICDDVLADIFLLEESDRSISVDLYVLKAEAGSGKSVFLRRLAWEALNQIDAVCLYYKGSGAINYDDLADLCLLVKERIYLFVDDALDNSEMICRIIEKARSDSLRLTIITAARGNEWNSSDSDLLKYQTKDYKLRYLSKDEIVELVALLKRHHCEGPRLREMTVDQCVIELEERQGRQLLVALHEATFGKPFHEILYDEYEKVPSDEAKSIYLTVCTLNRFKVPVRAGLIARVHGVSFEKFKSDFLTPLEHIVKIDTYGYTKDYYYTARHPEIAQIVFENVLDDDTDKYHEYVRILKKLNIMYSSDLFAYKKLINGRRLNDVFRYSELIESVFDIVGQVFVRDAYVYQQMANYERVREGGDLVKSLGLINKAIELESSNAAIQHTKAEIFNALANDSVPPLKKRRYRESALLELNKLKHDAKNAKYAYVTIIKIRLNELKEFISEGGVKESTIDSYVRRIEDLFNKVKKEYNSDSHFLSLESEFGRIISDDERALDALVKAQAANPRDSKLSIRLSKIYISKNYTDKALSCLENALTVNSDDKRLHFEYAMLLMSSKSCELDILIYHFRKSFIRGDKNYQAQFWYARCLFNSSDDESYRDSVEMFKVLGRSPINIRERKYIRETVCDGSVYKVFYGEIVKLELTYGYIVLDQSRKKVYFPKKNMKDKCWRIARVGKRVKFFLAFNYFGPIAREVSNV